MTDDLDDPFLVIDEAAKVLRVSRRTLDNYRSRKQGPPYRRHGGRIVYRLSDLLSWSERRRTRHSKHDKSREEPLVPDGAPRDRIRGPRVAQGRRPDPPLERQRQRRDWSVPARPPAAPEGRPGRHPPP